MMLLYKFMLFCQMCTRVSIASAEGVSIVAGVPAQIEKVPWSVRNPS